MRRLDTDSAVPLYRQIAEAIRYEIATGGLAPGQSLPTLHEAAETWGVNLHTVRRAYRELADLGLVRTTTPGGTIVQRGNVGGDDLRRFLADVASQACRRFGLTATEVAGLLSASPHADPVESPVVHVVECSETQSRDLAAQLSERWCVAASPWSLDRKGEPPPGPIVATYFHYNDVRRRWPSRLSDIHFAAIHPAPDIPAVLDRLTRGDAQRSGKIFLCERDETMASNLVADLQAMLPSKGFQLEVRITPDPATLLRGTPETQIVLFSPRMWGELDDEDRRAARALEVRYVFEAADIHRVANRLSWTDRISEHPSPKALPV